MTLVKGIRTSKLAIEIYSLNPDLVVDADTSRFEGADDFAIRHIVFNDIGAEEVHIADLATEGEKENERGFALI